MFKRFKKDSEKQFPSATPRLEHFIEWLLAQRPILAPASWRQYRAAVVFQLTMKPAATQREEERIAKALAALQVIETEEARDAREELPLRTSASKLKRFSSEDQQQLFDHLARSPTRNSNELRTYLMSGLVTGLRPAEWQSVKITCEAPLVLCVRNAKHDHVRGNGDFRVLTFKYLDTATRSDLMTWMTYVREAGDTYPALQGRLADALYAVTRILWPKRKKNITMYSTRHEFAAIAKLALIDRQDGAAILAALMGHASDVTATNHYGRYGKNKVLPAYISQAVARLPDAQDEEVASVRRKSEDQKQFLDARRGVARLGQ